MSLRKTEASHPEPANPEVISKHTIRLETCAVTIHEYKSSVKVYVHCAADIDGHYYEQQPGGYMLGYNILDYNVDAEKRKQVILDLLSTRKKGEDNG